MRPEKTVHLMVSTVSVNFSAFWSTPGALLSIFLWSLQSLIHTLPLPLLPFRLSLSLSRIVTLLH